jgi:adenine-specific DNA-methyltransferase
MPQNPKENFIELLKELFQLNNNDLDFGIYRILKLRSRDVEEFINNVLPEKLEEVKKKLAERASVDIKRDLEAVTTELKASYGDDFENKVDQFGQIEMFKEKYGRYSLLKEKLDNARISEELETDVYNELYRFFERYYEEGDFVTKPRAGDKTYMIPYDGEEVKLYWANYDQYYIKTGENFKNYVFTNGEEGESKITVEFRIKDVETSVNNNQNQKGRLFIPAEDFYEWNEADKKLSIYFYYKVPEENEKETWGSKQSVKKDNKGINEQLIIALEKKVNETNNPQLSLFFSKEREVNKKQQRVFYYHLNRYTSLNKFDYFIHKDLKKFLTRELDYFLKNEILSINFLDPNWREEDVQEAIKLNVVKAGVIREAAYTIINFLSELEDFQRRLFEKKKFVVQSEYVMTMDMIPEEVYDEVVESILNDAEKKQINEWLDLGFIESAEITKEEIESNKGLVIDTKYFEDELKFKLLNFIDGIDEKNNGDLINSENYQGINLIKTKYSNRITCAYYDPPYNTSEESFIYKNSYRDSSWIQMMYDRLLVTKKILNDEGLVAIAIDDKELFYLKSILDHIFNNNFVGNLIVQSNPRGRTTDTFFATCHDYTLFYAKNVDKARICDLDLTQEQIEAFGREDETSQFRPLPFRRSGGLSTPLERPNSEFPIYFSTAENRIIGVGGKRISAYPAPYEPINLLIINNNNQIIEVEPDYLNNRNDIVSIMPTDSNGERRVWRWSNRKKILNAAIEGDFIINNGNNYTIMLKDRIKEGRKPKTIWTDSKYDASSHGTVLNKNIYGDKRFSYPKSLFTTMDVVRLVVKEDELSIVLDLFGGSATTAHSIMELNKEDEGMRKFIVCEMGEYFNTVTLIKIKKIFYTNEWNNGKPVGENEEKLMCKYLVIEQYEDSLNNIVFDEQEIELEFEDRIKYRFREGAENSASIMMVDRFADPFNYKMEILQQNERKLQNVDLVTTFNFLLGIDVDKIKTEEHNGRTYRIITGTKKQQNYFVVWRKFDEALRLDEERDWIKSLSYFDENAKMYCNADNGFGAESTEAEFKRLMFEDVK